MRRYQMKVNDREFVVDIDELSADEFVVQVGDQSYEVALTDEQDLSLASITPQIAPVNASALAPRPTTTAAPELAPTRPAPSGVPGAKATSGQTVGAANLFKAPMPGVVLDVNVTAGTRVQRGQQIAVLEAMKMQNMLRAPRDGTIAEVFVVAGQAVGHGAPIVRFEAA
jgi:biotin carboxyl carrier protein